MIIAAQSSALCHLQVVFSNPFKGEELDLSYAFAVHLAENACSGCSPPSAYSSIIKHLLGLIVFLLDPELIGGCCGIILRDSNRLQLVLDG